MQYNVRNRRRLRPATRELLPGVPATPPAADAGAPAARAEGSGLHRRPFVITEINLTRPFQGRLR